MKIGTALTALLVIGMVGFATTAADAQCKAKETGCAKAQAKTGCSAKQAKAGCSAECMKTCSAQNTCNYTEAECANKIREHYKTHGWLGIEMNMDSGKPVITQVVPGSPAEETGFKVGDTLTSLNGIPYGQGNDDALGQMNMKGFEIGDTVVYTVNRDGEIITLRPTLARISEEGLQRMIAFHNANMMHKGSDKAEKSDK